MSLPDLTTHAPGAADDYVRSHDDALALLRYAVTGARVRLLPVRDPGTGAAGLATRRYEITVERAGRKPVTACDVYALPCHAGTLARAARLAADRALSA